MNRVARALSRVVVASLVLAPLAVSASPAMPLEPTEQVPEYDVKAAYLFNFAKFVDWPDGRFPSDDAPLRLCIFGIDPFGDALSAIEGKSIRDRRLATENIRRPDQATDCHIVFVPRREFRLVSDLLAATEGEPVLTVTEIENEELPRGIINLVRRGKRIVFQITPRAAERADLRISSRLLQLAEVDETGSAQGVDR